MNCEHLGIGLVVSENQNMLHNRTTAQDLSETRPRFNLLCQDRVVEIPGAIAICNCVEPTGLSWLTNSCVKPSASGSDEASNCQDCIMGSIINHLRRCAALFRPETEAAEEDRQCFAGHSPRSFLQAFCRIDVTLLSPEHRECGDRKLGMFKVDLGELVVSNLEGLFRPDGAAKAMPQ